MLQMLCRLRHAAATSRPQVAFTGSDKLSQEETMTRTTPMRCQRWTGAILYSALAGILALLAGCSGTIIEGETQAVNHGCIDDSKQCIDQRQAALKGLLADKSRKWVKEPATTGSYATGVRLFAFKMEKPRLTCDELALGRREADNAPGALRGPSGQGLSPATISRGVMFASEVSKELSREAQKRCRA
jgi:hypothetical protein